MPRKATKKTNDDDFNEFYAEFKLTPLQIQAVELLVLEGKTQKEITEILDIHRNTISDWVHKGNFKAAMQKCENERTRQTLRSIRSKSAIAVDRLWNMAESTNDKRVAKEIYMYIIDRDLGKITSKIEIDDNRDNTTVDIDMEDLLSRAKNRSVPLTLVDNAKTG